MLVVVDTGVLISGVLWTGLPHRLIELAEAGDITICVSGDILQEFREVLSRSKFTGKIQDRLTTVEEIMQGVLRLAALYPAPPLVRVVQADPDDDKFIACALTAGAQYLISGDSDLLDLEEHDGVSIVTVREFLEREFPSAL
jgi:putative PIN family toxin of toxin-antitoxin system